MQRHARCPPTRQHAPLNRRFTGGTRSHSTRRFVPGIAQHYVRLRSTMTSASIRFGPPSLLRSRPVALSAPSTGARLRRVPTISPLQPWRRAPFHSTNHSGHAGRIGHGSWRLLAIRSAFLRRPWCGSTQYITRPAAHAHPNGGSTPTGVTAGPAHTNDSIGVLRVPMACGRTDDKSARWDQ